MSKVDYLLWAFKKFFLSGSRDLACPSCGNRNSRLIRRKWVVTALRECPSCMLRFRTPKDDLASTKQFYTDETYKQGFTTDLPDDETLQRMFETRFAGTEKDFSAKIDILRAAGLQPGSRVFDFGASWGYASWQFRQAGFEVFTYEIGQERARYAKEKLNCTMVEDLSSLSGSIDCFFSSHVIEHLPDPKMFFDAADTLLKRGGLVVCCCPNGSEEWQRSEGVEAYDHAWGMVHPLMVTPEFMRGEFQRRAFASCNVYSSPVRLEDVEARRDGDLSNAELLTIGYRSS